MSASEDEYDTQLGGAIKLSAEDCVKIDALSANAAAVECQTTHREPVLHLDVECETPQTSIRAGVKVVATNLLMTSPFKRYRPRGRLSVTDLVAPTWCEVQFEYGLRQYRSRRLDKRPGSFISREGKVIRVEKEIAQRNDIVLREGRAKHTALEREIHPTQVHVQIKTLEEEWGLRLINMLSDVQTLMLMGKCREFRVVGFIHDHLVTGIIDEINRVPLPDEQALESRKRQAENSAPCTPHRPRSKRSNNAQTSSPEQQVNLDSFFTVTSKKLEHTLALNDHETTPSSCVLEEQAAPPKITDPCVRRTHTLYLIDSKTRLSASLPEHSATLSSRLQLMVYKRLLDPLVSSPPSFDFSHLWKHIGVDSQRSFSETFLEEASGFNISDTSDFRCLKDLESKWWTAVHRLGVNGWEGQGGANVNPPVNDQLRLVYRFRAAGQSEPRKGKSWSRPKSSSEEHDLQKALEESLRYPTSPEAKWSEAQHSTIVEQEARTSGPHDWGIVDAMHEYPRTLEDSNSGEIVDPQVERAVRESLREAADLPPGTTSDEVEAHRPSEQASSEPSTLSQSSDIIGQKRFKHNDTMLDTHLTNVLQWWHGAREPHGVAVEESSRCNTCEYMLGCEWREKALKALDHGAAKMKVEL